MPAVAVHPVHSRVVSLDDLITPKPNSRQKTVSFSKDTLQVQPPPNPEGRTWVAQYITREATMRVWREKLQRGADLHETAHAFGRVGVWARKGGEADGIMWMTCSPCLGSCLVEQQRQAMEVKLHRWHKERGVASGAPNLRAHLGAGGLCSCRWWACTRSWLVAENVAALANFKAVQNQKGWPANEPWASPYAMEREMNPVPYAEEMERDEVIRPWSEMPTTHLAPSNADSLEVMDPLVKPVERVMSDEAGDEMGERSRSCDRLCGDASNSNISSPGHITLK